MKPLIRATAFAILILIFPAASLRADFDTVMLKVVAPPSSGLPTLTLSASLEAGAHEALYANPAIVNSYFPVGFTVYGTWLGAPDVFVMTFNAGGTGAQFNIPRVGFTENFTAANPSALHVAINSNDTSGEDAAVARLFKELVKVSVLSTSDGNPNATTAEAAGDIFVTEGFLPAESLADEAEASAAGRAPQKRAMNLNLGFNAGRFDVGGFSGSKIDFSGSLPLIAARENVGLNLGAGVTQVSVAGGRSQSGAVNLTLPFRLAAMERDRPFTCRLIPFAGFSLEHSDEFDTTGLLWQVGVIHTLDYRATPRLVLSVVNQFSLHHSSAGDVLGTEIDDLGIEQQILKNGIRAVTPLGKRLIAEGFVVETNFLRDAAVKSFTTFGGAISWRATQRYNLSLAANYDTGRHFNARSLGFSSAWHW